MMNLALEAWIDESIRLARLKHYIPHDFIAMRAREDGDSVPVIARLMVSLKVQTGFTRMIEIGLRDWTLEACVLKFPEEFPNADVRRHAAHRLS